MGFIFFLFGVFWSNKIKIFLKKYCYFENYVKNTTNCASKYHPTFNNIFYYLSCSFWSGNKYLVIEIKTINIFQKRKNKIIREKNIKHTFLKQCKDIQSIIHKWNVRHAFQCNVNLLKVYFFIYKNSTNKINVCNVISNILCW